MTGFREPGRCPLCGREAILEWHNDGTHSPAVDVSEHEYIDVCYTQGTESDADGWVHGLDSRDEAHG